MEDRHLDLSMKFLEMGQALINEGNEKGDYSISSCGSFMILIGGLILDEDDIFMFGELCSMFSSKKILEDMQNNSSYQSEINKLKNQTYDDFIKRINKLRNNDDEMKKD